MNNINFLIIDLYQIIFSDESTFEVFLACPRYIRRGNKQLYAKHMTLHVKFPPKVMIWGCTSFQGMGRIHLALWTQISIWRYRLLPQVHNWNLQDFIFQQDSAPCHTSPSVQQYLADQGIKVLRWPGSSPDMNPIETVRAIHVPKKKLQQTTETNRNKLIGKTVGLLPARHQRVWHHLYATCRKLVLGMPQGYRSF